ncbi:hypothetical protein [Pseudoalteromonas rubra]|uniref:hypothetical protein n=1 Tax=Pseudoalteromonas rubra TaxID=43658 RepID=UPI000F79D6A3|nr:hypothetical protein [Pseudoalteromonas rubra]
MKFSPVLLLMAMLCHIQVNASLLSLSSYDLLDTRPEVPVRTPNARQEWDDYLLTLKHLEDGERVLTWHPQAGQTMYKVAYKTSDGTWTEKLITDTQFAIDASLSGAVEFKVTGCESELLCRDYGNELSTTLDIRNNSFLYLPQYVPGNTAFRVSYTQVADATRYTLQRSKSENEFKDIANWVHRVGFAQGHYDETVLAAGRYCYRLVTHSATQAARVSAPACTEVDMRAMRAPEHFVAQAQAQGIYKLSWPDVERADYYRLERESLTLVTSESESGSQVTEPAMIPVDSTTRFARSTRMVQATPTAPTEKRTYLKSWQLVGDDKNTDKTQVHTLDTFELAGAQNYRLSACDRHAQCSAPKTLSYTVPVAHMVKGLPESATAQALNQNTVKLSWADVPGADTYTVTMSRKGAYWQSRYTGITDTSFTQEIYLAGDYRFEIQACLDSGFCGQTSQVGTELRFSLGSNSSMTPSVLVVPEEVNPGAAFEIKWAAPRSGEVAQYEVQGELQSTLIKGDFEQGLDGYYAFRRPALPHGRKYCYKVRAWFTTGEAGAYTPTQCVAVGETVFDEVDNFQINHVSRYDFNVSWKAKPGASAYLLELQTRTDDGKIRWQPVYYGQQTRVMQQLGPYHLHHYNRLGHLAMRVSACNSERVCGNHMRAYLRNISTAAFLNPVYLPHKTPACISVPQQIESGEPLSVNWCETQHSGVAKYELLGELQNVILTVTADTARRDMHQLMTTTRNNLEAGREYCYKARAVYQDGSVSGFTDKVCTQIGPLEYPAPTDFSVKALTEKNHFELSWKIVSGASSYLMEQQTRLGVWQTVPCQLRKVAFGWLACTVQLGATPKVPELDKVVYRIAACGRNEKCGNFTRLAFNPNPAPVMYRDSLGNLYQAEQAVGVGATAYYKRVKGPQGWYWQALTLVQWQQLALQMFKLSPPVLEVHKQ